MWETEFSEGLSVPVPELYPELSDSIQNMQESDTEQGEMAKGLIHSLIQFNYSVNSSQSVTA